MAGTTGYPPVEAPASRERFLTRALLAGGTLLAGGALAAGLPRLAASQSAERDAQIYALALQLEQLQAAFYAEAAERAELGAELLEFAKVAAGHEREHVGYLEEALGSSAAGPPAFDFGEATADPVAFTEAAATLEDVAVGAYNGQAANLTKAGLRAAATIISVDARHAAWVRAIAGRPPASAAVDKPLTLAQVEAALDATGFLRAG